MDLHLQVGSLDVLPAHLGGPSCLDVAVRRAHGLTDGCPLGNETCALAPDDIDPCRHGLVSERRHGRHGPHT